MRGQRAAGNIRRHSRKEQRYLCLACGKTFTATYGTPYYRLRSPPALVTQVLTLLGHG